MSRVIGRGRYATETYPQGSGGGSASANMERFTPSFQTTDGNASIGDGGTASASFWRVGSVLYVQGFFEFSGAGVSPGTGTLFLPLPPGITPLNIDVARMPNGEDDPGPPHIIEGIAPVHAQGVINSISGVFLSEFLLAVNETTVPPSLVASSWVLNTTGLTDGDSILFDYAIPLL